MKTVGESMGEMNKIMRPEKIASDMREFQQANMKMEMTDELSTFGSIDQLIMSKLRWTQLNSFFHYYFSVNETLDDMLEESGDEEETNSIVNKVLDEIGIEISGKVIFMFQHITFTSY